MAGQITKTFKFSTTVTSKDLISLNKFISSEFKQVRYKMYIMDGSIYDKDNINQILEYDNYPLRKITKIEINANKDAKDFYLLPDFEISLSDLSKSSYSIKYAIRNVTEKELDYYVKKIDELSLNFKSSYSKYNSSQFIYITMFIFLIIIAVLIAFVSNKISPNVSTEMVVFLSAAIGVVFGKLVPSILYWLYPQTIFCIGKQEQFYENKKKLRNNIYVGFILAFVVSIFATVVVNYFMK
ncbi:MAG: hypothetical protein PWP56_2054 [Acetobacterium sp.]|nr:hypothetical protein [Acetobacterium sp.]